MPENEDVRSAAEEQEQEPEIVRSPDYFKAYVNSARVESSVWDFRLTFGEITKSGAKRQVEQSLTVIMSPQHAKAFLSALASNLREYETKIGQINLPSKK